MISAPLKLENFDPGTSQEPKQSPDYLRGVEDGRASVANEVAARQAEALGRLANTLSDMAFGYTEARAHLISRITPVLAQVAEVALPEILHATFAHHLLDQVKGEIREATGGPLLISVSAAMAEHLEAADLPDLNQFRFAALADLSEDQALIQGGASDIFLDLNQVLEELQTALRGLESLERTTEHG